MEKVTRKNSGALWIARTAIFIALLIAAQYITSSLGQFVTGSVVNFLLIAATLTAGIYSGIAVALVSPVAAWLIGIAPNAFLVPSIMAGNVAIVVVYYALLMKSGALDGFKKYALWATAVVSGAVAKFLVLYLGVVVITLPLMSATLKPQQIKVMSTMFSYPQLITALIGGAVATAVVPAIQAALKKSRLG